MQAKNKKQLIDKLHLVKEKTTNSFSLASFVSSERECLQRKKLLQLYDFDTLKKMLNEQATNTGFRNGYFKESYSFLDKIAPCEVENFDIFKPYGLSIYKAGDAYYSVAFVDDIGGVEKFDFITVIDAKEIFSKQLKQIYKDLFLYASLVIAFILIALLLSVKKRFFML